MIPNRLVLDTNVCLDLFVFEDPRWHALRDALRTGAVEAVTRADCRMEWLLVLEYPCFDLPAERRLLCAAQFDTIVTCLPAAGANGDAGAGPGGIVAAATAPLPRCSDADDQKFLEVARDTGAAMLITKDKALLKLAGRCRRAGFFTILKPDAWRA